MTDVIQNYSLSGRNLPDDPSWNAAGSAETRITLPNFVPGTDNTPVDGPNARMVSNVVVAGNGTLEGPPYSGMVYAWGQFIDHDLDRTATDGVNSISVVTPSDDPEFEPGSMMPLTRAVTDPSTGTQVNAVTGWLDASMIYGSDPETAWRLRAADGHMRTSYGDYPMIVDDQYLAGDIRVGENPDLIALHTLMLREHNYWADRLQAQHPDWNGDQIYNMARAVVTAELQNITYSEFLPLVLGPQTPGSYSGYDSTVDPRITQEFAGSAFRFGHTIVSEELAGTGNDGSESNLQRLADAFFESPAMFEANGGANGLLRHLIGDISQKYDVHLVESLRSGLFDPPVGQDLAAINIERGRDLGMPTLNQTREQLGLQPWSDFNQLSSDPSVAANLAAVYDNDIDKVELWIGGLAEDPAQGALVGPTFQTIIARQFNVLRDGDPLWFENQGFDSNTLDTIRHTTLSDLIMRNTDTMIAQRDAFLFTERHASDAEPEHPDLPRLVIGIDDDDATVAGGPSDDTIVAGLGANQSLTGSDGRDTFVFLGPSHTATITDFTPGTDRIAFRDDSNTAGWQTYTVTTADDGSAVVQVWDDFITLSGVCPWQLGSDDMRFDQPISHWSPPTQSAASGSLAAIAAQQAAAVAGLTDQPA